jgi:hypothetical protein
MMVEWRRAPRQISISALARERFLREVQVRKGVEMIDTKKLALVLA